MVQLIFQIAEVKEALEEPRAPAEEAVARNAFGAPVRDHSGEAVHNFGTVGGRNKRKAEGETEDEREAKKRKEDDK